MLARSAWLRVGEVVKMKPEDIGGKQMLIHVKDPKGGKYQYAIALTESFEHSKECWTGYKLEI